MAAVTGGVILEGCAGVTFHVVDQGGGGGDDRRALDVKDFSFLKRGIPSPNYAVVGHRSSTSSAVPAGGPPDEEHEGISMSDPARTVDAAAELLRIGDCDAACDAANAIARDDAEHTEDDDDDDDDEL
jgi:hypothetical protein